MVECNCRLIRFSPGNALGVSDRNVAIVLFCVLSKVEGLFYIPLTEIIHNLFIVGIRLWIATPSLPAVPLFRDEGGRGSELWNVCFTAMREILLWRNGKVLFYFGLLSCCRCRCSLRKRGHTHQLASRVGHVYGIALSIFLSLRIWASRRWSDSFGGLVFFEYSYRKGSVCEDNRKCKDANFIHENESPHVAGNLFDFRKGINLLSHQLSNLVPFLSQLLKAKEKVKRESATLVCQTQHEHPSIILKIDISPGTGSWLQ